ncbi:MAG: NAD(P)/FAD-dependent oxidoreductase [Candidatus Pacebacteria bacterium]|nr:NAD(P)/FAD-dependent oxidoreductase [Candidatus Paceibacterota bacterium]
MTKQISKEKYDLIVIGGGPSGMMAAGTAASNQKKVLLIEKNNELGKKLKISGGGRCNITNAIFDHKIFLKKFGIAEKFLYSTFSQFDVKDTFSFFESRGLPLVTEENNRVFPQTQKALDVFDIMKKYISNKNIEILTNNLVLKINTSKDNIISIETKKGIFIADKYIIATGGLSHPETGSTGDGFKWLKDMGHTSKVSSPNIVPLKVSDKWVKNLSGTSLSNMKITFYVNKKKSFSETGKILFTYFGISGPLILNLSQRVHDIFHEGSVTAEIDCFPDQDLGTLEKNIIKIFDENKNKSFKNIAKEIIPIGLSSALLDLEVIEDINTKVNNITKENRKVIVRLLKALPMTIVGLMGMDRAVISSGGIPLTEVDTKTMKSKLFKNLYLTGDILDINRPSGGFSLQLCWTTGYVAGLLK